MISSIPSIMRCMSSSSISSSKYVALKPLKEGIFNLQLNSKPVNALTPELLSDLKAALQDVHSNPGEIKGLILNSGLPKVFSAGLDLKTLVAHDQFQLAGEDGLLASSEERRKYKTHIKNYMESFSQVTRLLLTVPQPTITLVKGMAPAGGTVLSLCTDYRIGSDAGFTMGLNEVQVGMAPPMWVHELMLHAIGYRYSVQAMQRGIMFKPDQCLALGLVHKIVPDVELLDAGVDEVKSYLKLPQTARIDAKMKSIEHITKHFTPDALDQVVESISGPEFQKTCKRILAALGAGKK